MAEITSVGEETERFEDGIRQESQNSSSSLQDDGDKRGPEDACISIQMEDVVNWVSKFNERSIVEPKRLRVSSTGIVCSIHRVPHNFHQRNKNVYDPQVISIGPFHYGKRVVELQSMEEHKWRYLRDVISRKGEGSLEQYFVAVKELEESARKCYSEVIEIGSYSFVEMMVLDGCFIIEFLRKCWEGSDNDPIFELGWLYCAVKTDLLMLQNQIPFFILQCLFDLTYGSSRSPSLVQQALHFFHRSFSIIGGEIKVSNIEIQHMLHLKYTSCITFTKERYSGEDCVIIPSASKLEEGGIKFRKRDKIDDTITMLDIKFQNGVIEIPPIKVWDNTTIEFHNLIAFEQSYCHCKKYFTTYSAFMDCLIKSNKDVEILCQNGIIENWQASDTDVVDLFNSMARDISIYHEDFYLSDVCKEINQYYESPWPKLRATLVHDYFKNPWAIISFFAALLLLLLTMTQAFFSSFPKFAYGK